MIRVHGLIDNRSCIKSRIAVLLFLCVILLILCCARGVACAKNESASNVENDLIEQVGNTIDTLDIESLQKYFDSLTAEQRGATLITNIKQTLKALISGDSKVFYNEFINLLLASAGRYFLGFMSGFVTILIISILNSILQGMTSDFSNRSTTEVVHIVCYCAVIIVLMSGVVGVVMTVSQTIHSLTTFANAIFPVLLMMLSMIGGTSVVATYSPLLAALCGGIMKIISVVILPSFIATIVFSVVGNISKTVKLDKLTKFVKSASTWLMGIMFGVFAAFLTAQGISGGVVDKFGFNVAKFALSSYVPILGGYLSDGFDLITASVVLVKNALGYTGVLILMCVVLFPTIKIVVFTLALKLTSAIAEPIGDNRVATLLHSAANSMNLLISALIGVAFMFFLFLMLLIGSCNMGI